jgi:hypothetical protein
MSVDIVISDQLLTVLHDQAVRLISSPNPLLANWGGHLLEDWRSLELLAERQRDPERSETTLDTRS